MGKYKVVIFDFDGTIADSAPGILNSVEYALSQYHIPIEDKRKLNFFIGPPLYVGFSHVFGIEGEENEKLVAAYRERYTAKGAYESTLFPGIMEVVKKLKEQGVKVAVASSKPTIYLNQIIRHLNVEDAFDTVVGNALGNHDANKTALISQVLKNLSIEDPEGCIMVGDRFYDVQGAHGAGIPCIGVLYGYGEEGELASAGAEVLVKDAQELQDFLL